MAHDVDRIKARIAGHKDYRYLSHVATLVMRSSSGMTAGEIERRCPLGQGQMQYLRHERVRGWCRALVDLNVLELHKVRAGGQQLGYQLASVTVTRHVYRVHPEVAL